MNTENRKPYCPSDQELMTAIIDNEGNTEQIASIRQHVDECELCSATVQQMQQSRELMIKNKPGAIHLSPMFTASVMDQVYGVEPQSILDDILGLSKKVVTTCAMFVVILLAIMFFPEEGAIDDVAFDGIVPVINDIGAEFYEREDVTYEEVVTLTFADQ